MDELEALVGLNLSGDVASVRLSRLREAFGTVARILDASVEELMRVQGIGGAIAAKIAAVSTEAVAQEFTLAAQQGVRIIACDDPEFPHNLRSIDDVPIVLYIKGRVLPEDAMAIAVVGSRRASLYGLSNAGHLAGQLAAFGMTVVSGMARGIDTSAHRGALKAGGRTIAVIGSGLANLYPPENARLAEEICARGAVISEFPMRAEPCKLHFPRRNRLISGLSLGVLVVEAARNSGALITAGFAAEQGRDVFALPGNIDAAGSFGANTLIQQGAKLVACVEDIIEEMPFVPCQEKQALPVPERAPEGLSCTEHLLYTIIFARAVGLDELVEQTGLSIQDVSGALVQLQLKKRIKQVHGGCFIRSPDAG